MEDPIRLLISHPPRARHAAGSLALLLLVLCAGTARATDPSAGKLMGWVEDSRGTPVAGAIVSLFSKGMRGGGLVAFSDDSGRFVLPALPAGSYTVRAVGHGLKAASARQITVLPNQESVLSLSLAGLGELSETETAERERELTWLVRHKQRSVLEEHSGDPRAEENDEPTQQRLLERLAPWLPEVGGSVAFVANAPAFGARGDFPGGDLVPTGTGAVQLAGKLGDTASFKLGGLLAENEDTQWRMATEFIVEPGGGHQVRTGAGYGTRFIRPISLSESDLPVDGGAVGALFIEDSWTLGESATATGGVRASYIGFVEDRNMLDPSISVELRPASRTRLRGTAESRTLAPGGDLLTLSTLSSAPAINFADFGGSLRAERIARYEVGLEQRLGSSRVGIRVFREATRDQLVNAFRGLGTARSLQIFNGGAVDARGVGFDLAHDFSRSIHGSVTYAYGHAFRGAPVAFIAELPVTAFGAASFHDVSARLESFIDATDTRFVAFYRVNLLSPDEMDARLARNARFDVQLSQGLPFLSPATRADWEVLLAVRNLYYETDEGGTLDELAVVNPPTRVMGGISVRF